MADIDDCIPNLATPKPLPHPQQTVCVFSNLDLTPEKKPCRSELTTLNEKNDHILSRPIINSTARTQLKIEELRNKKGKTIKSLPVDTLYQSSDVIKVIYRKCWTIAVTLLCRQSMYHLTLDNIQT